MSVALAAGLQPAMAAPAAAGPGVAMHRCQNNWPGDFTGWSAEIDGRTRLQTAMGNLPPGSVVRVTASGSVHNGSWFGQWRGPDGSFNDPADTSSWPAVGVNKFALYGKWMRSGETFRAGSDSGCLDYTAGAWSRGTGADDLAVGVNDDRLDDNAGSFRVSIRVWTNPSDVVDGGFEQQRARTLTAPWFGEGAGYKGVDVNLGRARVGRNNAFIRATSGWSAVVQRLRVVPHRTYRMTAWVRTSGNVTGGMYGVRQVSNGSVWRWGNYGEYAPSQYLPLILDFDSGPFGELNLFIGYWAPGSDSWVQIDDVQVRAH